MSNDDNRINERKENKTSNKPGLADGDKSDIYIALAVSGGILALMSCSYYIWYPMSDRSYKFFYILSLLGGGSLGWAVGILVSPYNKIEEQKFAKMTRAAYAFVSGYLLAKIDPLIASVITALQNDGMSQISMIFTSVFAISFVNFATSTYVTRKYW